jgi:hypothetical protein
VQIGTENRKQVIIAGVLGAVALIQIVRMAWPSGAAAPVSASAAKPAVYTIALGPGAKKVASEPSSLDPTLRLALLRSVEGISYNGTGRNIFVEQQEVVIPKVVTPVAVAPSGPPQPPPPPPITLKFFGFANRAGEAKKVFLSEGEDVFIAAEGDIVNRRFKVVHIGPNAVEIEDVLYNHSQSIPLTQQI